MSVSEKLGGLRAEIDEIDTALLQLFERRMKIAEDIAKIKKANSIEILDSAREKQVIDRCIAKADKSISREVEQLMTLIMSLSRERQRTAWRD